MKSPTRKSNRRSSIPRPCDTDPALNPSATLLSRLAEAVDGLRDGRQIILIAPFRYDPKKQGHRVIGPFKTCKAAQAYCEKHSLDRDEFGIFGPFYTHRPRSFSNHRGVRARVAKVVLHLDDGREICLNGQKYDTVFWGDASVDKFLVPYYTAIGTIEEAMALRNAYDNDAIAVVHLPGSEWVDVEGPLEPCFVRNTKDGLGLFKITQDVAKSGTDPFVGKALR